MISQVFQTKPAVSGSSKQKCGHVNTALPVWAFVTFLGAGKSTVLDFCALCAGFADITTLRGRMPSSPA